MAEIQYTVTPSGACPSGEHKWGYHLRFGGAPGSLPTPDFSCALESTIPVEHTIVLRHGWAITSSATWASPEVMVADVGSLVGRDKALLRKELRPLLPERFGLLVLASRSRHSEGNQSSLLSAAALGLAVVKEQLRFYGDALNLLQDYCNARLVGGRKLSGIATVRAQLGDAHRRLRYLEQWTAGTIDTAYPTPALIHEVRILGDELSKLGGGRTFLSGGFREAIAMFEILANLYPGNNDA